MSKKSNYATVLSNKQTTQHTPIPGRENEQVKNEAGGYVFQVTPFQMLERFLILGTDKPTYYATAEKLTKDNAANVRECLKLDGKKTVDIIVAVSSQGRAPKNDAALFALAVAATPEYGSQDTAQYALSQLSKVARIGTHLFHFAEYLDSMRGWGRSVKNAIGDWYTSKTEDKLAYQLAKYQQRDGWSTKDLVTLAHVKAVNDRKSALLAWAAIGSLEKLKEQAETWTRTPNGKKYNLKPNEIALRRARFQRAYDILTGEGANRLVTAFEAAKTATTATEIVKLIREGGLTHEMIPTQFKTEASVWEAFLEGNMPMTAMVRNLGVMSKVGLLKPLSNAQKVIVSRLNDREFVRASKIHPMQLLLAKGTYGQGHGRLGNSTWEVVRPVVAALEAAFYLAFANVVPTGKARYMGLDISGSMGSEFSQGSGVTCAQAGAALCLVTAKTEPNYAIYGFASGGTGGSRWGLSMYSPKMVDLGIDATDTLETAMRKAAAHTMGGTDCSLPMIHAGEMGLEVDAFEVITDNETWAGDIHPTQALKQYRKARGKDDVRLIVQAMTPSPFSIADPTDQYNLDVVGFDSNVPALIADFIRGEGAGVSDEE